MQRLVNTIAMTAALVAAGMALWRDYGVLVTFKRAAIAYFAFFIVGSLLAFVFKAGIEEEWIREASLKRSRDLALKKAQQKAADELQYAKMHKEDEEAESSV